MTLTAITFPIMRFALCVALLAMCFIASQCTADPSEPDQPDATDSGDGILSGSPVQPGSPGTPGEPDLPGTPGATGLSVPSGPAGAAGTDGAAGPFGAGAAGGLGGTGPGTGTGSGGSGSSSSTGQGNSGGGSTNGQGDILNVPAATTETQPASQVEGGDTQRGSPPPTTDKVLKTPGPLEPEALKTTTTSIAPGSLSTVDARPLQPPQQQGPPPSSTEGKKTIPGQTDVVQQLKIDPQTTKTTTKPATQPLLDVTQARSEPGDLTGPKAPAPASSTITTTGERNTKTITTTTTIAPVISPPPPVKPQNPKPTTPGKVTAPVNIQRTPTTTTAPADNAASQTSTTTEDKEPNPMQKSVSSTSEPVEGKSIPLANLSANLTKGLPSLDNKDSSIGSSSLLALAALTTLVVMAVVPAY